MRTSNPHRAWTRAELRSALGPVDHVESLQPHVEAEEQCAGYLRRLVSYNVPAGRASAFVCVPTHVAASVPVIFCHHQHAGDFSVGKSEVCGLRGSPDQAYAAELAQRGYVTIAPDALGFEDRNWADGQNISWYELSSRLVIGRTLLATCLQEISLALDYVMTLPEVDPTRIGFVGHSYGGRAAVWAPAWDERISASVSNCGCIGYRDSFARDAGFQPEFVVPNIARDHDIEDVLCVADQCQYLVMAAQDDTWSRGADQIHERLAARGARHVRVDVRPGAHEFPQASRTAAYEFLASHLGDQRPSADPVSDPQHRKSELPMCFGAE